MWKNWTPPPSIKEKLFLSYSSTTVHKPLAFFRYYLYNEHFGNFYNLWGKNAPPPIILQTTPLAVQLFSQPEYVVGKYYCHNLVSLYDCYFCRKEKNINLFGGFLVNGKNLYIYSIYNLLRENGYMIIKANMKKNNNMEINSFFSKAKQFMCAQFSEHLSSSF